MKRLVNLGFSGADALSWPAVAADRRARVWAAGAAGLFAVDQRAPFGPRFRTPPFDATEPSRGNRRQWFVAESDTDSPVSGITRAIGTGICGPQCWRACFPPGLRPDKSSKGPAAFYAMGEHFSARSSGVGDPNNVAHTGARNSGRAPGRKYCDQCPEPCFPLILCVMCVHPLIWLCYTSMIRRVTRTPRVGVEVWTLRTPAAGSTRSSARRWGSARAHASSHDGDSRVGTLLIERSAGPG